MKVVIDIPEEFKSDYNGDLFKEFFSRVLCDIQKGTMCGTYEIEIAEMFLKAFDESKLLDTVSIPKFNLGDEFWVIHLSGVSKEKITMLQQKKDGTWKYRFSNSADYTQDEYGVYFFSTKEEAENAIFE